jgi:predicted ATPase
LQNKWTTNTGWPKRLETIEIKGLRGWEGQRIDFQFPIVAIVGENGSGKSTVIQCAASVYQSDTVKDTYFPTDFLPDTPWEKVQDATIAYSYREGTTSKPGSLRKTAVRWRGYSTRPKRKVQYIDLSRVQPVSTRTGYSRLANPQIKEVAVETWEVKKLSRLSQIMGRSYEAARMALTEADQNKKVSVLQANGHPFSGFHQGAGETTMSEFLDFQFESTSLILIDEIETSLHPRVQRRLIRDLAEQCRMNDVQVILTTHSPYVLDELPLEARIYILKQEDGSRQIVTGVSPEFAMTKMDEENHPECDVFVEDAAAEVMIGEILVTHKPALWERCQGIPYGSAQVGYALGQMAASNRFPRPTCVFVDGDQEQKTGCSILPGGDAPEPVIFRNLEQKNWADLHTRLNRGFSDVADTCKQAMTYTDHHDWVRHAANKLLLSGSVLWQAMCGEWARSCLSPEDAETVIAPIEQSIIGFKMRPKGA